MSAHITWDKGGEARVLACSDDAIDLASTRASPPGSRPEGVLASGERVKIKVHRCVRDGEIYKLQGRLIDATRALRDHLAALGAAGP